MSLANFLVHDIVIQSPAFVVDNRGNNVKDWTNATSTAKKAWMAQVTEGASGSSEIVPQREGTESGWRCFVASGTTVTNLDRILYSNMVFEVVGHPLKAMTPEGEHHTEIPLRLVEG